MLTSNKIALRPLLESTDGIHLTAYLVNGGSLIDTKAQLREAINQSREWLSPVMSAEELTKFLDPLEHLLQDARILKQMKGNVGIFRNQGSFRVLSVPVDIEHTCQVATSFHVKPLLRWLQADQEFLLLGLEKDAAHLYAGNQASLKLVDSILFPEALTNLKLVGDYLSLKDARQHRRVADSTFTWLSEWISEITNTTKPKLFVAGEKALVDDLNRTLRYKAVIKTPVANSFSKNNLHEICVKIRALLSADSKATIEKSLIEFRFAEEANRARRNIFQISRDVVKGRVRKLIVSGDLNIFGKIDKKSGGLAIHPFDLDHEDDDILDDLAQMVLSQGGEVIVASRTEIPKGRPILAILDDDGKELEKTDELLQYEFTPQRSG